MLTRQARNELLAGVRLTDRELKSRYEQAIRPDYWQGLCPHVPFDSPHILFETAPLNHSSVEDSVSHFNARGYFKAGPLIPETAVALMRECVEVVRNAGWPPVFAFAYDPFWAITR